MHEDLNLQSSGGEMCAAPSARTTGAGAATPPHHQSQSPVPHVRVLANGGRDCVRGQAYIRSKQLGKNDVTDEEAK